SGISHSNSSSSAITSSTVSSESAPRSSTKEALLLTSSSLTPSCSTTIFLTRSSMLLIGCLLRWRLLQRIVEGKAGSWTLPARSLFVQGLAPFLLELLLELLLESRREAGPWPAAAVTACTSRR